MKLIFSDIPEIDKLITKALPDFEEESISITKLKDISYGTNFAINTDDEKIVVSVYFTAKNGFKFVFSANSSESTKNRIQNLLYKEHKAKNELNIKFDKYMGMDEAGKGDYFGPLVIAGFIYDKSIESDLIKTGVADSKKLSDDTIRNITKQLISKYPERIKVNDISPERYNKTYHEIKLRRGNLNTLLAEGYRDLIAKSIKKENIENVVIDKFANEKFILDIIRQEAPDINAVFAENAERDLAVAAASIIARAVFVKRVKEISAKFHTIVPLGGGEPVNIFGKAFYKKYGEEALLSISKNHFKNTNYIISSLF